MKTLRNLCKKNIFATISTIAIVLSVGYFTFSNNANSITKAQTANPGDVIITEFMTNPDGICDGMGSGANEWFELLNTTQNSIDVENWGIVRQSLGTPITISGVIPAGGIITVAGSCTPNNDSGDVIVLNDNTQPIFAISYGTQDPGGMMHSAVPLTGESAQMVGSAWITTSTDISKGWFNADPSNPFNPSNPSSGGAPSQGELAEYIMDMVEASAPQGSVVNTNFGTLEDPSSSTGLYFEIEGLGKLELGRLNLTDNSVFLSLLDIGSKLIMSGDSDSQKIGLDASTSQALQEVGATLKMYGLNNFGFSNAVVPNINVLADDGVTVIEPIDPSYPSLTDINYDDSVNDGTLTFRTDHFTQFETDNSVYVNSSNNSGTELGTLQYPYNTIQEGIDALPVGWVVRVLGGSYEESLSITKSVKLVGDIDSLISINSLAQDAIVIDAPGESVEISGFTIYAGVGYDAVEVVNGNVNIYENVLLPQNTADEKFINNLSSNQVLAERNFFYGRYGKSEITADIAGDVDWDPWYLDSNRTTLSSSDISEPYAELSNDIDGRNRVKMGEVVRIIATFTDDNGVDYGVTPTISIDSDISGPLVVDAEMTRDYGDVWYYDWTVPNLNEDSYIFVDIEDIVGNPDIGAFGINSYVIDNFPPELSEVTPVPALTNDNTPSYTFSIDDMVVGENYNFWDGGKCNEFGGLQVLGGGLFTVTFNQMADGIHNDCVVIVTDEAGNESTLNIPEFEIDTRDPGVSTIGSSSVDYELPSTCPSVACDRGDIYGAQINFDEDLDLDSMSAVEEAITNGASVAPRAYTWSGKDRLRIYATEPTVFSNPVVVTIMDTAGNSSVVTLINSNISSGQIALDPDGDVVLEEDGLEVIVYGNSTIEIPSGVTDSKINVDQFTSGGSGTLPEITINSDTSVGNVLVQIPDSTGITVSDPSWTGIINTPTVQENNSVTVTPEPGKTTNVTSVIEIGFGDTEILFDRGVRIYLAGQAGRYAGYSRGGVFTQITNNCSEDSQVMGDALPAGGDCKIDLNGGGLAIWTKHFTSFVTYTQSSSSSSGGSAYSYTPPSGGGSGDTGLNPPLAPEAEEVLNEIQYRTETPLQLSQEEIARREILMKGTYDYELITQSPYPAEVNPGDLIDVWIEVKNTGTATWFGNGSNITRLGSGSKYGSVSQQRDYVSEFANDTWLSANRTVNILHPEIRSGWHTRFQFKIKAPATPGTYKAYFTPVVDGLAWMKDIGIYWEIKVK